jgi:hypothetical protein
MDLTLDVSNHDRLVRALIPGSRRPCVFIPGIFSESMVGGVHRLTLQLPDELFHTQGRIIWFAPATVIAPFVPGIGVSIILEHPTLSQIFQEQLQAKAQTLTPSLVHCASEVAYDRFTLPSRLH